MSNDQFETMLMETNMKDEQALTDRFEELCGSVDKAQRLFRIWQNAYAHDHPMKQYSLTREQVFERQAKSAGYTQQQINAFYACQ